jgi:hypothetical protein
MLKSGRVVQFYDDTFGYQRLRFGFFPVKQFLELDEPDRWAWCSTARDYCKDVDITKVRNFVKELEKITKDGTIKKVVKETGLDKALE